MTNLFLTFFFIFLTTVERKSLFQNIINLTDLTFFGLENNSLLESLTQLEASEVQQSWKKVYKFHNFFMTFQFN